MSGTSSPTRKFRDWVSKVDNTVYLAVTDGIVLAGGGTDVSATNGYTDSSNPPTTLRLYDSREYGGSITMPVKKGDYWKVTYSEWCWWIPEA